MLSLPAWRTLLRLLDDPHQDGFPRDQLRQLPGGCDLLASPLLVSVQSHLLAVDRGDDSDHVDYYPDENGLIVRYQCPESGLVLKSQAADVIRYSPSIEQIGAVIQQQLNLSSPLRDWVHNLSWLGEAAFNERYSTILFAPHFQRQQDAILADLSHRVVRTPAVIFTGSDQKIPFCWQGGWGVALPLDQCMMPAPGTGARLDPAQIAAEIRRPHHTISRRLVEFEWSSHTLRIAGIGAYPIAKGEAAAVVQRLAEAVWNGEEMVPLSQLRKAAGTDTTKSFKDMMGRTANQDQFILKPQQGYYALRITPEG
jgi:hypothetical protein